MIRVVWEHNGDDTLLHAADYPGAYARGASFAEAAAKLPEEVAAWQRWADKTDIFTPEIAVVEDVPCTLHVRDADSDVLLSCDKAPLSRAEYEALKALALRSAADFHALYASIPDKNATALPARKTFYGDVPVTAEAMYQHTKSVNDYYFGEIGVDTDHEGDILACRKRGFMALEAVPDFLHMPPVEGSYGEFWSLRKVFRRFIWHDRIHAKAMVRMAKKTFGELADPFQFGE